ncbi:MAG: hypothetical protein FJ090_18640 [Deltaproteobacteria bacterium]|nr:hypothetical protein [Deltaproteobacteria bacterium]
MTMRVVAPGKLVVAGEYAVLDGAPALVAAVDRGVACVVEPADQIEITTPGDDRFVRAALDGAPPARYTFADDNPVRGLGGKPGFGGSAAATVAATAAAGFPAERAYAVHERVQGGGSGIDVYASIHGGFRQFELNRPPSPPLAPVAIGAAWPGQSASTGPRVQQYRAWRGREAFVQASREIVLGFAGEPVRALRENYALLRAMAREAGIVYDLDAFAQIDRLAATFGGAAKPSGAGGGDIAVVLFPTDEELRAFGRACPEFIPLRIAPGAYPLPQS